jgi:hypothetical protein
MPTSTRSETGDRVGSFFYPPNGVHIYKPPVVSRKHASRDVLPAGIVRVRITRSTWDGWELRRKWSTSVREKAHL